MTKIQQIVETLQEELSWEADQVGNSMGGRRYLPVFFEKYVLKDILGKYHPQNRFDSKETFEKFMNRYAVSIYQPDATAYAWEYSHAAVTIKRTVLARVRQHSEIQT